MSAGRTIRLYLAEGVPTGIRLAEIINWTGNVLAAPRSKLAEVIKRPEIQRTGVYLLIGDDPEIAHKQRVYVGEATMWPNASKRTARTKRRNSGTIWLS